MPAVQGTWRTPGVDPFSLSLEERRDLLEGYANQARVLRRGASLRFEVESRLWREMKVFASTEGSLITQVRHGNQSWLVAEVQGQSFGPVPYGGGADRQIATPVTPENDPSQALRAYEAVLPALLEEAERAARPHPPLADKPIEPDRYDVVFAPSGTAWLLANAIVDATRLDWAWLQSSMRNDGDSYLTDPLAMVGNLVVGSPLVTVRGTRMLPGGLTTAKWDDEGVETDDFSLVKEGVLVDFQTTREGAALLAPYYQKRRMAIKSHGCSAAPSAYDFPVSNAPDIVLEPGKEDLSFDDLVRDTKRGIAILDYQGQSMREIVNGKLGAKIVHAEAVFNPARILKQVVALGGPSSARFASAENDRTGVMPNLYFAVPVKLTKVAIIDQTRRA
ncbi:MAG TPA: metallopeptidase TldD-related protein [Gemmatimonadaceae bacterium]|nr:metallopeptidase TldD-related protein [Gemmatimonadaceae bacterium]